MKTQEQVVDFYHVTQYLWSAAEVLFAASASELRPWIDDWCQRLKHEIGASAALIADLELRGKALGRKRLPGEIEAALTSLRNQVKGGGMNDAELVERQIPLGSGVTETACKVIVKHRLCGSGMRWQERGAAAVLSLRCLTSTPERWSQFWSRVERCGFPVAA